MSAALARLRRHFGDDLISRTGGRYELTPFGLALLDRTAAACGMLERVFDSHAEFDPAREDREFTIRADCWSLAGGCRCWPQRSTSTCVRQVPERRG